MKTVEKNLGMYLKAKPVRPAEGYSYQDIKKVMDRPELKDMDAVTKR
jgi:hypothetical protein